MIKDAQGRMLNAVEERKYRWKEYTTSLYREDQATTRTTSNEKRSRSSIKSIIKEEGTWCWWYSHWITAAVSILTKLC